jgi:hypothetical protein
MTGPSNTAPDRESPAGGPPEMDSRMSAEWMTGELGFFSSHPRWARQRLLLWFSIAFLPLAVGAFVLARWASGGSLLEAMELVFLHGRKILLYGFAAGGFALGLGLTAALAARASRSPALVADSGHPAMSAVVILAILLSLGVLPWLVPLLLGLDPRTRTFLALLGVLPLVLVVAVVSFMPAEDSEGRPIKHGFRWWTLIFPGLVVGLAVTSQLGGISEWISRLGGVDRLIRVVAEAVPSLEGSFALADERLRGWIVAAVVVIVAAPVLCASIMLMASLRDAAVGDSEERRLKKRASIAARVRGRGLLGEGREARPARRRLLGLGRAKAGEAGEGEPSAGDPQVAGEPEQDPPPEWLARLRDAVDPSGDWGDWVAERFVPGETSPPYEGEDCFREYFAGVQPSRDQVNAFRTIYDRFAEMEKHAPGKPVWDQRSCDVLLEGPVGSGRTAVAAASVVQAAVVRGHTSLVLVPSGGKASSVLRRIRKAARESGVARYLSLGVLTAEGVRTWAEPGVGGKRSGAASAGEPVAGEESLSQVAERQAEERQTADLEWSRIAPNSTPDVLVGTLADFERTFFSGAANFERLAAVLSRIELVVVEDLDLFPVRDRIHLPFILNKIRLLLGAEGRRCQTIVVAPGLVPGAREYLEERLLSATVRRERVCLRPFGMGPDRKEPWHLSLRASKPGPGGISEVIERCAKACVEGGTEVIIHSPSMSASERREIGSLIASAGTASVRVVADLDDLDFEDRDRLGAVFHAAREGVGASLAIRGHAGSTDVVVFSVLPSAVRTLEEPSRESITAIPSGRSRALFPLHLASMARFLGRGRPIHRRLWSKFGLAVEGELAAMHLVAEDRPSAKRPEDQSYLVDPPDPVSGRGELPGIWSWVAMGPGDFPPLPSPVDLGDLIDHSAAIEVEAGGSEFVPIRRDLGRPGLSEDSERRRAEWLSEDRQSVGADDLAYAPHLRFESGEASFFMNRIDEPDGRDLGAIRIEGALWSERHGAATQPYLVAWRLEEFSVGKAFLPKSNALSCRPDRFRLVEVDVDPLRLKELLATPEAADPKAVTAFTRQFLGLKVAAVFDERGGTHPQTLRLRYESSMSVLSFGFPEADREPTRMRTLLLEGWPDPVPGRRIVPELGAALTFAIRRHLPGLERLARCIGIKVRCGDGRERYAAILVEPRSTSGTAYELLSRVTRDPQLASGFFETAARSLETAGGDPDCVSLFSRGLGYIAAAGAEVVLKPDAPTVEELAEVLRGTAADAAGRIGRPAE